LRGLLDAYQSATTSWSVSGEFVDLLVEDQEARASFMGEEVTAAP
jgi:hypothetical protein